MPSHRVTHEPAYVLHHYDWSESSLIVEAFTRAHGRMALVAKGAKRPSSNFRPVLLPLQPLLLSSGYYANELLLRLLAREDAHPRLFDAYAALVHVLASPDAEVLSPAALRAFELLLLRETGHLPALDVQTLTLAPIEGDTGYRLVAEGGLREAHGDDDGAWLPGLAWQALAAALGDEAAFSATLQAVAHWPLAQQARLRQQLRELLHYHGGGSTLRTRQLMLDLQRLKTRSTAP